MKSSLSILSVVILWMIVFSNNLGIRADDCISNPADSNCVGYQYPNSTIDVISICSNRPNLIECSVRSAYLNDKISIGKYENSFSILATICKNEQDLTNCANYNSLCKNSNSLVRQCEENQAIPNLLKTSNAISLITNMCGRMRMSGCSECGSSANCADPLDTISKLCLSMEMSECASFNQMCSSWNSFGNAEFYCGGSTANENVIPMMKMYFHSGIVDYVLFQGWVPTKGWQYGLTWTFIAILGIGAVAGRASLAIWEKSKEAKAAAQDQDTKKKSWKDHLLPNFGQFQMNLIRASFLFPILVVEFCLMLVAMTFNVGLFFAVILGYCFGIVLFGHVTPSVQTCCTK